MITAAQGPTSPVFGLPRVPRSVITRPRLTGLIADLLKIHDLIIVRAPTGGGKTVALADWASSGATEGYISWLALDDRYTDRTSFWREIILGTSQRVDESVKPIILECADALMAGADPRTVLHRFVPCIPSSTIVIDRVDLVKDEELFADMLWVLQKNRKIKAVVTVRGRSFLDSPAVTLALDTTIIGAAPLQLTVEETEELLNLRSVTLDAVALHTATAGHPLLTRAAMTVYGQVGYESIEASVQTVVADYLHLSLTNSRLGQETKDFMVRTSIPESFTISLAEQLTGSTRVSEILDDLEDQGLGTRFTTMATDRFQYSPAVRELLKKSLTTLDTRDIDLLTRIVIDEDLFVGNVVHALRQAVSLGDLDLASDIACEHHITLLVSQSKAVLAILEGLPLSRLRKHPALIMAMALCHNEVSSGRVKAMEYFAAAVTCAAICRSSMDPGQRIWMLTVESSALRFSGKLEPALKLAKRAVEAFEESPILLKEQLTALEPTLYTQAAIAYLHDRQLETARELLIKALDACRRAGSIPSMFLATGLLAYALAMSGRSTEARAHLSWLNDSRWPPGMLDGYWATTYRLAQVREAMDRQSFEEATGYLDLINEEMQVSEFWTHIVGFRSLLDLHGTGLQGGPATLEARIRTAHKAPLNTSGQIDLDCLRAFVHMVAGQHLKASAVLSKYTKPVPQVLLVRARIALSLNDPAKALVLTRRIPDDLGPRSEVHRLLLRSAALDRLGDTPAAQDNAKAAASLMTGYGLTLTGALIPQGNLVRLTEHVLANDPEMLLPLIILPSMAETASLTPRELVVLNTFAERGTASKVAASLNVSVNTVKSQRRSILKKLGATSLEEALTIARRQRLLED